jgi:type I restriction enzyme S subunit
MTPLGFYEQSNCPANTPFVISAGAAGEVGYSTVEFWAADDCFYFICPENLQYRFLFYALMCQREFLLSRVRRASVPRLARSVIEGLKVPLPPLPVQAEIVRILDTFSSAVTELEAEHAARVRQYENYRNELLSFDSKSKIMEKLLAYHCLNGVDYLKLKEVARISAGGDLPENYIKGQKVPTKQYPFPIYSNGTDENALYGFTDNYKIEKEAVTISARGTIGYHQVRAGKFTPIVRLITMIADESKITTRFLNYVLYIAGIEGVNTGIPSLTVPMLEKINIPLPPLPVQEEIVSILDRFETLVNDLRSGLPAEIALRRKQYEYYRDRLLTFKPLNDV